MSLGKSYIINNIYSETSLSKNDSKLFLEHFLETIKSNKSKHIKISNFGGFYLHKSLLRIGRNPKTNQEHKILPRIKLSLKTSSHIKKRLN